MKVEKGTFYFSLFEKLNVPFSSPEENLFSHLTLPLLFAVAAGTRMTMSSPFLPGDASASCSVTPPSSRPLRPTLWSRYPPAPGL